LDEDDDDDREVDEDDGVVVWDDVETVVWLVWSLASLACADATADWSELTVVARLVAPTASGRIGIAGKPRFKIRIDSSVASKFSGSEKPIDVVAVDSFGVEDMG